MAQTQNALHGTPQSVEAPVIYTTGPTSDFSSNFGKEFLNPAGFREKIGNYILDERPKIGSSDAVPRADFTEWARTSAAAENAELTELVLMQEALLEEWRKERRSLMSEVDAMRQALDEAQFELAEFRNSFTSSSNHTEEKSELSEELNEKNTKSIAATKNGFLPFSSFRMRIIRDSDEILVGWLNIDEQIFNVGIYSHLDISLFNFQSKDQHWEQIKFKMCRDGVHHFLEFRRGRGWPEVFHSWPGTAIDQYGEVLRLSSGAPLSGLIGARDKVLIKSLAVALPEIIASLASGGELDAAAVTEWVTEARIHQESLEVALADSARSIPNRIPMSEHFALRVQRDEGEIVAEHVKIDEQWHRDDQHNHLDISIFNLIWGDHHWKHLKFKICRDGASRSLEFRRGAGWPEIFQQWPGYEADEYSEVLRLWAGGRLPEIADARDRLLLTILAEALPCIVASLVEEGEIGTSDASRWGEEARIHRLSIAGR